MYEHSICATTEVPCKYHKSSGAPKAYPVCFQHNDDHEHTKCIEPNKAPKSDYVFKHCGCCVTDNDEDYCT